MHGKLLKNWGLLEFRSRQLFASFTSSSTDTERNLDPFQQPTLQFCILRRTHKHLELVYTPAWPQFIVTAPATVTVVTVIIVATSPSDAD